MDFQLNFGASWPRLPPTATDQTDPPSLQNATPARGTRPTALTDTNPSYPSRTSSVDTSHSSTNFAIRLVKPQPTPTQGSTVVLSRIDTLVRVDIDLPSGSWRAVRLPLTKSVNSDDSSHIGRYSKALLLLITVRGATTRQEYICVCEQCEKRTGNKTGSPSLIDFHSSTNVITPKGGSIQVDFMFSCYSRHHQKQDQKYVLEVILKDISNSIEVARKVLPYFFDVNSSRSRIKESTNDQTQQADTANIRRGAKRPRPAATPSPPSSVELVAGLVPTREGTGQRTSCHFSSIAGQSRGELQPLPPAISASYPSAVPEPLLVEPQYRPSHGQMRGSLEGGQGSVFSEGNSVHTHTPRTPPTSDPGARHLAGGSRGSSYDTSNTLPQQEPRYFDLAPMLSFMSSHMPPVQMQGMVAYLINALEKSIEHLRDRFEADGQEKGAALHDYLDGRVLTVQQEIANSWAAFSAERQQAGETLSAEVAKLEEQIHALKRGNHEDTSLLPAIAEPPLLDLDWMMEARQERTAPVTVRPEPVNTDLITSNYHNM